MTSADLIIIAILALSALLAFMRGFVREVLSIGAWVGAALATIYGFPIAQPFARKYIEVALFADIAAGVAIFVVALIVLTVLSHALSRNVRDSALGAVDRSLGLLFGLVRGAVLVCLAYLVMAWAIPQEDRPVWVAQSRTLPLVQQGAGLLLKILPESALKQGEDAVGAATSGIGQAIDAGKAVQTLTPSQPSQPATNGASGGSGSGTGNGGSAAPDSGGANGTSGYNDAERKDLNRLLENTQP
ncbi:MAG TPA: CvpA family protein [Hypericibacter adhaerens]|jgi:membrane protein required for colicin V production|uniref:Colicin V biosynthesis protein n=1 Tax=Hypericibacter adhaerens TaxID=2602016 RepID=A0A5J6MZF9_9PROT|nr:CvpA family protein [Hypericibacter adhaerens]QEX23168.1 colicin V biosynthesis protein [Hypericibacter adhaerens]HWA44668.1 CvpA family protein [Hypericibacter adhaerens]